ncbi:MAG: nicotinate-nucleotide adenylyltransferase [Desulfobacterota bacterium]|nr:nicotinate-nucleotide adenylyltransferase [Thermodesulfobacteriota bacterium]
MRLGILGGSFDPIHNGHLAIADSARIAFNLEKIIFVPAYCPPHKARPFLAPYEHRFRMVERAVAGYPLFTVSDIEANESCPSYAGTTVEQLQKQYGRIHDYFFIIGLDALLTMIDYEKSKIRPGMCHFIATTRPGFAWDVLQQHIPEVFRPYIHINEMPALSISSSEIRDRVRTGKSIDGMVPDAVKHYIETFKIYTSCFT